MILSLLIFDTGGIIAFGCNLSSSDYGSTKFMMLKAYIPCSLETIVYLPSKARMPAKALGIGTEIGNVVEFVLNISMYISKVICVSEFHSRIESELSRELLTGNVKSRSLKN